MKQISIILGLLIMLLACANNEKQKEDVSEIDGEKLYKQNCVLCHGADGKLGVNGAKDITVTQMTLDERINNIKEGAGLMTGFKTLLTEEEIEAIAKYTFKLQ